MDILIGGAIFVIVVVVWSSLRAARIADEERGQ